MSMNNEKGFLEVEIDSCDTSIATIENESNDEVELLCDCISINEHDVNDNDDDAKNQSQVDDKESRTICDCIVKGSYDSIEERHSSSRKKTLTLSPQEQVKSFEELVSLDELDDVLDDAFMPKKKSKRNGRKKH